MIAALRMAAGFVVAAGALAGLLMAVAAAVPRPEPVHVQLLAAAVPQRSPDRSAVMAGIQIPDGEFLLDVWTCQAGEACRRSARRPLVGPGERWGRLDWLTPAPEGGWRAELRLYRRGPGADRLVARWPVVGP